MPGAFTLSRHLSNRAFVARKVYPDVESRYVRLYTPCFQGNKGNTIWDFTQRKQNINGSIRQKTTPLESYVSILLVMQVTSATCWALSNFGNRCDTASWHKPFGWATYPASCQTVLQIFTVIFTSRQTVLLKHIYPGDILWDYYMGLSSQIGLSWQFFRSQTTGVMTRWKLAWFGRIWSDFLLT